MILLAVAMMAVKPQIVMIHGAGGGGWEYAYWKPIFEKAGYRVIAKDLDPVAGGLEKTTFEDYVNQVVASTSGRPTILLGASMGGALALKAADRVQPVLIVLVSSAVPRPVFTSESAPDYPKIIKWKNGPYEDTVSSMPDADEATRKFAFPRWRDESGAVLNELKTSIEVRKPSCPVLSIIPEGDDTVKPDLQQQLAYWAGADTIRYQNMSHIGPLFSRRREEVAHAIIAWLDSRISSAKPPHAKGSAAASQ